MQNQGHVLELPVLGMTCAACVRRVEKAVAAVPGVTRADVNLPLSRAQIELADGADLAGVLAAFRGAALEGPADALEAAPTGAARLAAIDEAARKDSAGLRRDATVAIVLTAPLLAIAMAHGLLDGMTWVYVHAVLGTIVVLGPGMRYFRAGLRTVRHAAPDMRRVSNVFHGVKIG